MNSALIYDIEIVKAIPDKREPTLEGIEYCAGWDDHANMGISCICCYDYLEDRVRVFCKDNFGFFIKLCADRKTLVTFNGIGFDNKVIKHALQCDLQNGTNNEHYDILAELWEAAGLERKFVYPSHLGFSLGAVGKANFGLDKTGSGSLAPVDWQHGHIGNVIDYCIQDIKLTKRCFERIRSTGGLRDPRDPARFLEMKKPQL